MTTPVWNFALRSMFAAAIMLAANLAHATVAAAEEATSLSDYASPNDPPIFDTPAAAVDAFKRLWQATISTRWRRCLASTLQS